MITFFDIPSAPPLRLWSPNTWKTRFTLNYKGIPYKTEWTEYPDIKALYTKYDVPPTARYPDGSGYYSLPLIHDDTTGKTIGDSLLIAKYLDETYPDTPKVLPTDDEKSEQFRDFYKEFGRLIFPIYPTVFKECMNILAPPSRAHFAVARAKDLISLYGPTESLDDITLTEDDQKKGWAALNAGFDALAEKRFGGKDQFTFLFGDAAGLGDFAVAGVLLWLKAVWGEDSEEWKGVLGWSDGKWATLIERLEPYSLVTSPSRL